MQAINLKIFNELPLGNLFSKILPPVLTVVLTIVLANDFASLTWLAIPSPAIVSVPADPTMANSKLQQDTRASSNSAVVQIANWHLFGEVPKDVPRPVEAAPVQIAEEAPDTTLHLTLKGVMSSKDMMSAWAIIADRMGNEDSYGIDSQLPDNAVLKEIYVDRVILMHNGRLETLRLPAEDSTGVSTESPMPNVSRNVSRSPGSTSRTVVPSGAVTQLNSDAVQVVKSYKEKLLSDPQSVMNTLRAEPYRQGGELKGYRIFPGKDKDLFGQVGLEPGDVVTAVNGIELDSPLKGLEIMQNITDATEVSVNVLRNGVNQTFMVPLN